SGKSMAEEGKRRLLELPVHLCATSDYIDSRDNTARAARNTVGANRFSGYTLPFTHCDEDRWITQCEAAVMHEPRDSNSAKFDEGANPRQTVPRKTGPAKLAHRLFRADIRPWLIPVLYSVGAISAGFTIPRLTSLFLPLASTMSIG